MNQLSLKKFTQFAIIFAALYLAVKYFSDLIKLGGVVWSAASPLVWGCVIAYVLNILMKKIESLYFPHSTSVLVQKSRRLVSVLLAFVVLFIILLLIINIVLPEFVSSIELIAREIPGVWDEVRAWGIANADQLPAIQQMLEQMDLDWADSLKKMMNTLAVGAGGMFTSVVGLATSAVGKLVRFVIGLIFAIYLLFSKEKLLYVLRTVDESFTNFIVGQCMEAVILGVLCALGMTLLRLPYAVMTGTIIGVSALIPVAGAYIGGALGAFMIFTVDPLKALIFLVFLVILQQIEGNLIYPRVVGNSIGLPGLWVLAAVTVGGGVLGVSGMLLGVPLSAALYKIFADDVKRRAADMEQ